MCVCVCVCVCVRVCVCVCVCLSRFDNITDKQTYISCLNVSCLTRLVLNGDRVIQASPIHFEV